MPLVVVVEQETRLASKADHPGVAPKEAAFDAVG